MTRGEAAHGFLDSPEAHALTVDASYRALLGRAADATGMSFWAARSASKRLKPWAFTIELASSAEFAATVADGSGDSADDGNASGGLLSFAVLKKKRQYQRFSLVACAIPVEQAPCDPVPIANEDDCS